MAKLEPEFEEVSEPSQLFGPSPKAKVHCVVIAVSRRARVIIASTARSLVGRRQQGAYFFRHLRCPYVCQMYDKRSATPYTYIHNDATRDSMQD